MSTEARISRTVEGLHVVGHAENEDGRFTIPLHEKAVVVFDGAIHDLAKLSAGGEG